MRGPAQCIPGKLDAGRVHYVDRNGQDAVLDRRSEGFHEQAVGLAVPKRGGFDDRHPEFVEEFCEFYFLAEGERLTGQATGLLHGNVADKDPAFHTLLTLTE